MITKLIKWLKCSRYGFGVLIGRENNKKEVGDREEREACESEREKNIKKWQWFLKLKEDGFVNFYFCLLRQLKTHVND